MAVVDGRRHAPAGVIEHAADHVLVKPERRQSRRNGTPEIVPLVRAVVDRRERPEIVALVIEPRKDARFFVDTGREARLEDGRGRRESGTV